MNAKKRYETPQAVSVSFASADIMTDSMNYVEWTWEEWK